MFKQNSLQKGKQDERHPPPVKVLLVATQAFTLAALSALLQTSTEITVIGQVNTVEETQAVTGLQPPITLLVDIDQPTGPNLSIVAHLRHHCPTLPLAISTLFVDPKLLYALLPYSIQAYLTKDLSLQQFFQGLKIAASGGSFFSPTAMAQLRQDSSGNNVDCSQAKLTVREQDLFNFLCQGASFRAIANQLHLSEQTVRNYASLLYEKLGVRSKGELMAQHAQYMKR